MRMANNPSHGLWDVELLHIGYSFLSVLVANAL